MGFWLGTKKREVERKEDIVADNVVIQSKVQSHRKVSEANKNINRLNKLLINNGITLEIYKATGNH